MNGFLEQTHTLHTEDVDMFAHWRLSAIFAAMQEAGSAQCEQHHLGVRAMREQNLAWVVNRAHLHMERLPHLGETVTVRTWPKPPRHQFFPRYYLFLIEHEVVGSCAMLYAQLDLTTRRMAGPWLGGNEELTCALEPPMPAPGGLPSLTVPAHGLTRQAGFSDLDLNGHVNNTRYLDWMLDCHPTAHHRRWEPADVLIHYNREIRPEEQVALALQRDGAQSVLRGEADGVLCFAMSVGWVPREPEEPAASQE